MIVFTIIGYVLCLCVAWQIGKLLAIGREAWLKFDSQVSEIEALCLALAAYASGVPVPDSKGI